MTPLSKQILAFVSAAAMTAACFIVWDFHQYLERMRELGVKEEIRGLPSCQWTGPAPMPTALSAGMSLRASSTTSGAHAGGADQ